VTNDAEPLFAEDFVWKLSQVRQCVPTGASTAMPDRFDAESLLMLDLVQTEHTRDEWERIATSYRMLAEQAIEALAKLEAQNRRMRALIVNMGEELTFRKPSAS
jgi:hypothetical protein